MSQLLIHIGYAKAGSTYLQKWFENHPEMYFQPNHFAGGGINLKHFAGHHQKMSTIPEVYALSSEYLSCWPGDINIYGMYSSSTYDYPAYQAKLSASLKNLYPTAKILIVTRGYNSIFGSLYAQHVAVGGCLTFEKMMSSSPFIKSMLDYSSVIQLYQETFGESNVLVLPMELLNDNPRLFTKSIEEHVNIKNQFSLSFNKINSSSDLKTQFIRFKISRFIYTTLRVFPKSIQIKIYKLYVNSIIKGNTFILSSLSNFKWKSISREGEQNAILSMKGKADLLKENPQYASYLNEYLIE